MRLNCLSLTNEVVVLQPIHDLSSITRDYANENIDDEETSTLLVPILRRPENNRSSNHVALLRVNLNDFEAQIQDPDLARASPRERQVLMMLARQFCSQLGDDSNIGKILILKDM